MSSSFTRFSPTCAGRYIRLGRTGLPGSGQVGWPATVDWRRSGELALRWTIALDSHGPLRRYSTFFVVVVSIEALTNERNAKGELSSMPRHMYRGQRARRILLRGRDPRWRRKTVLPRHEDGKRERKTIAIYARM